MAALILTLDEIDTGTLPTTPGEAREVVCPPGARWLYLRCEGGLRIATTGADGAVPAKSMLIADDERVRAIRVPGSGSGSQALTAPRSVYVTSTVADADIEAWAVSESAG